MAMNYTTVGPVKAMLCAREHQDTEVTVLAFGWNDAEPEKIAGVWALGAAPGLTFIPESQIESACSDARRVPAPRRWRQRLLQRPARLVRCLPTLVN